MSVLLMGMVWKRYPASGGELLLALALADQANHSGAGIYLGVQTMAEMTRQGVRTVQVQLRKMRESGWLQKVNAGHGGRSRHTVYRINPDWIKGADPAPFSGDGDPDEGAAEGRGVGEHGDGGAGLAEGVSGGPDVPSDDGVKRPSGVRAEPRKGAAATAPFSETERVQFEAQKGAVAAAPAYTTRITRITPPYPLTEGDSSAACASRGASRSDVAMQRPSVGRGKDRAKAGCSLAEYIADCQARGVKPVPEGAEVFRYADKVGIPADILLLHWRVFRDRHLRSGMVRKGWLDRLLTSVEGNWYGVWVMAPGGECTLGTKGLQAQAFYAEGGEP